MTKFQVTGQLLNATLSLAIMALIPAAVRADIVIPDDVVVLGSGCIGFDCTNGEPFGSDTLRLKENVLRIHFEDTSTGSNVPSNDWRFRINDPNRGGKNFFALDDLSNGRLPFFAAANASNWSVFIDESANWPIEGARVGIGTNRPITNLHVRSGNSPTIRLEQDTAARFDPQTWDIAGNEKNFFIIDQTNGSQLPFRVETASPTNSLYVQSQTGNVGVGTSNPEAAMHVIRTNEQMEAQVRVEDNSREVLRRVMVRMINHGACRLTFENTDSGVQWFFTGGDQMMRLRTPGTNVDFDFEDDGDFTIAGMLNSGSSRELKENFRDVNAREILRRVNELPLTTWNYRSQSDGVRRMGPVAEDFYDAFGLGADNQHVAPMDVGGVAMAAIQGLQAVVDDKDQKIAQLEQRLSEQESRLQQLEELVAESLAASR